MLIIIGFLFTVFICVLVSIMAGLGYGMFLVDFPSALIMLIFLFFFLITSKSGSIIGRYIKSSFKKNYAYTKTELASLSCAIKNTVKFSISISGFGFLIGVIACLTNLENKNMLGPSLALSLLTVFYAITISYLVFFPTQAWAENKINSLKDDA